jgi:hypothetical protein
MAFFANYQHFNPLGVWWQTGNGANFNLFWERDAGGILPKKVEVFISGALFLCPYFRPARR